MDGKRTMTFHLISVVMVIFCQLVWPAAETTEILTLEQAITQALANRPLLEEKAAAIREGEGRYLQAGRRSNPAVELLTENWRFTEVSGFTPADDLDITAAIILPWERADKRMRRTEAAESALQIARLERELAEWNIRREVTVAFLVAMRAQKQLDMIRSSRKAFQEIIDYHEIRVREGALAEADLIKVQLEGDRLKVEEQSFSIDAEKAMTELYRAMGLSGPATFCPLMDDDTNRTNKTALDSYQEIVKAALESRLEIRLAMAALVRAEADVRLEQARAHPDWNVSLGYKRTAGFNTILAGVSIPLAVFDKNRGNIAAGQAGVDRYRAALRRSQKIVEAEVAAAMAALKRIRAVVRTLEEGMLQRAEESRAIATAAYREGGYDLLRLLDAERSLMEARSLRTRFEMEYRITLAELETAVGIENLSVSADLLRVE